MSAEKIKNLQEKILIMTQKHKQQLQEKDEQIAKLVKELNVLRTEIDKLKTAQVVVDPDNDYVIRKILEFKANLYTVATIQNKLAHIGIDKSISFIRSIADNIEALDKEHRDFYHQCVEDFNKSVSVNSDALKQSIFHNVQLMRDSVSEDLKNCPENDYGLKQKLRSELANYDRQLLDLAKSIDDKEKLEVVDNFVDEMIEKYEETKNKTKKQKIDIDIDNVMVM
jgi:hypothetical protein